MQRDSLVSTLFGRLPIFLCSRYFLFESNFYMFFIQNKSIAVAGAVKISWEPRWKTCSGRQATFSLLFFHFWNTAKFAACNSCPRSGNESVRKYPIIVADNSKEESLTNMARQAKVIINTVGPVSFRYLRWRFLWFFWDFFRSVRLSVFTVEVPPRCFRSIFYLFMVLVHSLRRICCSSSDQ